MNEIVEVKCTYKYISQCDFVHWYLTGQNIKCSNNINNNNNYNNDNNIFANGIKFQFTIIKIMTVT